MKSYSNLGQRLDVSAEKDGLRSFDLSSWIKWIYEDSNEPGASSMEAKAEKVSLYRVGYKEVYGTIAHYWESLK